MPKRAVIIGGGISGLSVAFFLSQKTVRENLSLKITVLEAEDRFGGVLKTLRTRDFHMEAGADAFDGRDPAILAFCRDLGLQNELVPCGSTLYRVFLVKNNKFLPITLSKLDPFNLFKSSVLSLTARARLTLEGLIPAKRNSDDETIADFVRRRFGGAFLKELAEPLARGVLMGEVERLSVREYFPHWENTERELRSFSRAFIKRKDSKKKEELFFTLRGGLDRLAGALLKKQELVDFQTSSQAVSLERDETWKVFLRDGRAIEADLVLIALPAPESAKLLAGPASRLAAEIGRIRYDSLIAVNMIFLRAALPARFPESGFIVPARAGEWPFASLKVIGNTEEGKFLRLRAFISGTFQSGIFSWEDEKIQREILRFLSAQWRLPPPCWIALERYPKALVQYETGHAALISDIESLLETYSGLFLAGNGYRGFGISDCIRSAKTAVEGIKIF
jgi:oxygen-dependent protoporphyrinogen oxidase